MPTPYPLSDTHCHTIYSDGSISLAHLVKLAKICRFPFVTKTDHNTTRGNRELGHLCADAGLVFIPGVEISTKQGHLLGYGVSSWTKPREGISLEDAISRLHEQGAIAVMAHPFDRHGIREKVFRVKDLQGWEILNGASPLGNLTTLKHQRDYPRNPPRWAGSDSHGGIIYGHYYTRVKTTDVSRDGILKAMWKGQVEPHGKIFPLRYYLHDGQRNQIYLWKKKLIRNTGED